METLRIEKNLAQAGRECQAKHKRSGTLRDTNISRMIEFRNVSRDFSWIQSGVLDALSRLREFFSEVIGSGTMRKWEDNFLNSPHPELMETERRMNQTVILEITQWKRRW